VLVEEGNISELWETKREPGELGPTRPPYIDLGLAALVFLGALFKCTILMFSFDLPTSPVFSQEF
jgi:hypothetical protein